MEIKFIMETDSYIPAKTIKKNVIDILKENYIPNDLISVKKNYIIINYDTENDIIPLTVIKCLSSNEKINKNVIE